MGLFDIFSNDDAQAAADAKKAGINAGYGQLSGFYDQGRGALTSSYDQAQQPYAKFFDTFMPTASAGYNAYGDATGANGAAGQDRARANFQTDPGYQFSIDQGTQAIDRNRAAQGMLASGNTDTDLAKFVTGQAAQQYGNYVSRLQPYTQAPTQFTYPTMGSANLYSDLGKGLNASYTGQGAAANSAQTGIGDAQAGAELAKYTASANEWSAIMQGAKMLAGAAGGMGGMGGGGGGLFDSFGSGSNFANAFGGSSYGANK